MTGSENPARPVELGDRLRAIREEVLGEDAVEELAGSLGIESGRWTRYENDGEHVPAEVLLGFIELTGADPLWLFRGTGDRFRQGRSRFARPGEAGSPHCAEGSGPAR